MVRWVWGNTLYSADLQLGHGLSLAKYEEQGVIENKEEDEKEDEEEWKGGEGGHRRIRRRRGRLKICHQ